MKTLKFRKELVPLVLDGSKTSTWRLFDDKNLSIGDDIELRDFETRTVFANARIVDVVEKKFAELTQADKIEHGVYDLDEQMYKTFSQYYKTNVGPQTAVKIIRFEILKVVHE